MHLWIAFVLHVGSCLVKIKPTEKCIRSALKITSMSIVIGSRHIKIKCLKLVDSVSSYNYLQWTSSIKSSLECCAKENFVKWWRSLMSEKYPKYYNLIVYKTCFGMPGINSTADLCFLLKLYSTVADWLHSRFMQSQSCTH